MEHVKLKTAVLLLCFSSTLIQVVLATTSEFNILGNGVKTVPIHLLIEDHVTIKYTSIGAVESSITCPNGTISALNSGVDGYRFTCNQEGDYILKFRNPNADRSALVALNYEVEHYMFGMPQMFFLALVVAVICVLAVAVFVMMSKSHY